MNDGGMHDPPGVAGQHRQAMTARDVARLAADYNDQSTASDGQVSRPAELHAWLVAQWQARLDVARAATLDADPGAWYTLTSLAGPQPVNAGLRTEDAEFMVDWPPTIAIAVCEAALRRLARHAPEAGNCSTCYLSKEEWWGDEGTFDSAESVHWPCPEVLDDAAPFADRPDFSEELRRGR